MLAAGDTIRSTQSAVVLENLIGQFLFNKAAEAGGTGPAPGAAPAPPPAPAPGAKK
jgi:phospholipid/cholesterol/gamma-HCH transport system substrate-binding protein